MCSIFLFCVQHFSFDTRGFRSVPRRAHAVLTSLTTEERTHRPSPAVPFHEFSRSPPAERRLIRPAERRLIRPAERRLITPADFTGAWGSRTIHHDSSRDDLMRS